MLKLGNIVKNSQFFYKNSHLKQINYAQLNYFSDKLSIEQRIENKIVAQFNPSYFEIQNESKRHSRPGNQTHFNVVIVSNAFEKKNAVQKHQMVYKILGEEFQDGLHAITITAKTQEQWDQSQEKIESPGCRSGKKSQ
ncbi:BolA protein [Pseudocohnilembus persalinus]|uniref:BolA protein n=1 Tax=Pseudocohnilembus persalinus TaxID=266149 RepID=A0A0V0QG57_PSEPJ|nr:BolA protein [Pseudocohnilembus persalinus]|eukprot:KRX01198.1 BolA protein [Pseudocohnilembus persalinus]